MGEDSAATGASPHRKSRRHGSGKRGRAKPPPGNAAAEEKPPLVSVVELEAQKREVKQQMRAWEHDFEEACGGLVPTHDDKKPDARYAQLKAQAKRIEHALEASRRAQHVASRNGGGGSGGGASALAAGSTAAACGSGGALRGGGRAREVQPAAPALLHAPAELAASGGDEVGFAFEGGHISLSPFHIIVVLILATVPYAAFIAGFSLMGFGAMVYDYLVSNGSAFYPSCLSATGLLFLLYVFDVTYWQHPCAVWARRILLSLAGCTLLLGGTLASDEYPHVPLLLAFLVYPAYWWLVHTSWLYSWPLSDFLRALARALALLALAGAAVWIAWVLKGNNWDVPNKRRYMLHMRCCTSLHDLPQRLHESGYASMGAHVGMPTSGVLALLNLTEPISTSSIWDGAPPIQ